MITGNEKGHKFPPKVRKFCLGLHFKSAGAYDFVRETFENNLPHPSTLRLWYANSKVVSEPGINQLVVKGIKNLAAEKKSKGEYLIVCLSSDEIHIRKHIQWCNQTKSLLGYSSICDDDLGIREVANQVLVFMVNGVNQKINIPIAHFFIARLGAEKRKELHVEVLKALLECGVLVSNIVFDGLPANAKMCKLLEANFNIDSMYFDPSIEIDAHRMSIIYDNCHMLKLIRNTLGRKQCLYDASGAPIKWKYFEKLVDFKKSHEFQLTHKMNRTHLNWQKHSMKVNIAVQTLSASTANSMQYLLDAGCYEFVGAEATIKFTKMFNDLFDVFNTKHKINSNDFKMAISANNEEKIFKFFEEAKTYIQGLEIRNEEGLLKNIVKSKVRTGFVGFIINMESLKNIYNRFVKEHKIVKEIGTFHLGQDPLELFFGKARALNGYNDNPTIQQFSAALKKLIACDSIKCSKKSNCEAIESDSGLVSNIYLISSKKQITQNVESDVENYPDSDKIISKNIIELHEKMTAMNEVDYNILHEGFGFITTTHIAYIIEQKLKGTQHMKCHECFKAFTEERVNGISLESNLQESSCRSTFEICKVVEKFMKLELLRETNFQTLKLAIYNEIDIDNTFSAIDISHDPNHKLFLIRFVIDACINIKGTQIAKEATLDEHRKSFRKRFRKLIHFYGQ